MANMTTEGATPTVRSKRKSRGMHVHRFWLRPDFEVALELPTSLDKAERNQLACWVKALQLFSEHQQLDPKPVQTLQASESSIPSMDSCFGHYSEEECLANACVAAFECEKRTPVAFAEVAPGQFQQLSKSPRCSPPTCFGQPGTPKCSNPECPLSQACVAGAYDHDPECFVVSECKAKGSVESGSRDIKN